MFVATKALARREVQPLVDDVQVDRANGRHDLRPDAHGPDLHGAR